MASRPAQSGRASSSALYQSSACERTFTKTRVEPAVASSSRTTAGSMASPRWPAQEKRSGRSGSKVSTTRRLSTWPWTSTPGRGWPWSSRPSRVCMASSRLPSVADMPQTLSCGLQPRSRARASCSCTPRLLPSSSCHSSATTRRTEPSSSRASARASSRDRLSGVVTSTVGSWRDCALRSALPVSPVRAPTVQRASAGWSWASACKGVCSALSVSAARARMGVIHSTVSGAAAGFLLLGGAWAGAWRGACAGALEACAKACSAPSQTA